MLLKQMFGYGGPSTKIDDINDENDDKDHNVEKTEHCVCKRSQV